MADSTGRLRTEGRPWGDAGAALAIGLLFLGVGARVQAEPSCSGTCRYVSAAGSGTGCTFAAPCSLDYGVNSIHANPVSNLHIVLLDDGGTYWRTQPIVLNVEDSGTPSSPVSIEAGRNEKPVLSGGTQVTGWQLFDAAKDIWRAPVPAGSASRQLYVNGTRAQRARGYFHANFVKQVAYGYDLAGFPLNWAHVNELEIVALGQWKTVRCPVHDLATNEDGSTKVTLESACWQTATGGQYFVVGPPDWVENAYELIDEPGEWYLERAAGLTPTTQYLYYKPRAGENMAAAEVVLPRLGLPLLTAGDFVIGNAHDIVLSGLTFAHTSWTYADATHGYVALQSGLVDPPGYKPQAALRLWADALQVKRCTFEHLGGAGIVIENPSSNVQVEGNVFRDIASDAIMVGDTYAPLYPNAMFGNVVSNNYITEIGRDYYDAAGVFVGVARDTTVAHNELRNLPYTGIQVGWFGDPGNGHDNTVDSNLEASVVQRLWDGGAVYTLSDQPNSTIISNVLHTAIGAHEASEAALGASATGIYLDNGTQHYLAENNLVGSTPMWAFIQSGIPPYATNNIVQHNFSDTSAIGCDPTCYANNVVIDNQVFTPGASGNFPPGAWATMGGAGIVPSFASTRPTITKVEVEDYNEGSGGSYDTTSGNSYGNYRQGNVDVSFCSTCSNDHFVQAAGAEWLRYYVDSPSGGVYDIGFRVATADAGSSIQLFLDGIAPKTLALPNTGGLTQWQTVTLAGYPIPKGPHIVQLLFAGAPRLDYFTTTRQTSPCPTGGAPPSNVLTGDFDGNPETGPETLRVYAGALCWDVAGSQLSTTTATPWLSGWGSGNFVGKGDFDGDGHDDVLVIYQNQSQWHWAVALSTGYRFEQRPDVLLGWGNGGPTLIGDFDGDGKDDATVIFYWPVDSQWHWHLAQSTGNGAFAQYPDAQVGYGSGNGMCVKNLDADAAEEIVIQWSPSNYCAKLDGSHHFVVTTCSATCP